MKNIMYISNGDKARILPQKKIKIDGVYKPCINAINKKKYNIYAGTNSDIIGIIEIDGIKFFNQNIYRNIFAFRENLKAYRNINYIINKYNIDIIHCNTPIGAFLGRICGHKNNVKKVIYTAHGFHFYKGNNIIKNFIFRNIEKYLARYTDAIITMNKEDYEAASKFKLRNNGKIYFTHGVGVNVNDFKNINIDQAKKRSKLGISKNDIVLISIGDVNDNKNISLLLDVIKEVNITNLKCLICGEGPLLNDMKKKAMDLNLNSEIVFLGYRNDIRELLNISDIYISTSKREGLPRALMEAMAAGLPCVVSKIRGNIDLIDNDKGGYCCDEIADYIYAINNIINNNKIRKKFVDYNNKKIIKYSYENVYRELTKIYKDIGL